MGHFRGKFVIFFDALLILADYVTIPSKKIT